MANQKRDILFAQDILFALDKHAKLRNGHSIIKYLEKKFPMTPLEKSVGVLGTESLFKNTFFNGESLEAFKKQRRKILAAEKKFFFDTLI